MKIVRAFPLTIAIKDTWTPTQNPPFMAIYAQYDSVAAAKCAHENREAELNAPWFGALTLLVVLGLWFGIDLNMDVVSTILVNIIAVSLSWLGYLLLPGRKTAINVQGEAVECVVRSLIYDTTLDAATIRGAEQLEKHYGVDDAYAKLVGAIPDAVEWVDNRMPLISYAEKLRLQR